MKEDRKKSKNLLRRYKKIVLFVLAIAIFFNVTMLLYSFMETRSHWGEEENWLTTSQEFNALSKKRSIVFVHGYGGSPYDLKPLIEKFKASKYRLVVPIIPGQNKKYHAYQRGHFTPKFYRDWLMKIVEKEYQRHQKKPFVVGFSMGGALSTTIATSAKVEKLVLIAPFYALPVADNFLWQLSNIVAWVFPIVPKFSKGQINDPKGYAKYLPGTFIVSLSAFDKLKKLSVMAQNQIPQISIPVQIHIANNDKVASATLTNQLFKEKNNVKIYHYPRANHVMLYDYDQETIVKRTLEFLREFVNQKSPAKNQESK